MAGRQGLRDKNCKFLKSNMADGRHFENRFFGHYPLTDCSISAKFCMPTSVQYFNFVAPLITEKWSGSQNKNWELLISSVAP